ncbi:MAG: energy-coupled thiamine transporter ThiT [Erysipelotrichaceae bacterium]|nr:energy-coupled thiamine transporter ThiT [Erysipelotrichaceae bacterium]
MSKSLKTVRIMVFMALYAALTIVLDYAKESIPFTTIWANGGSIDISLIALVFASVHLGWKIGVITSLLEFLVSIVFGATKLYFAPYSPGLGFMCDYIIPIVIMGMASIFVKKNETMFHNIIRLETGIVLCMIIRILSQVISGVYCWTESSDIGSLVAWSLSLEYNLGYGIPTMIMLLIVMPVVCRAFMPLIEKRYKL